MHGTRRRTRRRARRRARRRGRAGGHPRGRPRGRAGGTRRRHAHGGHVQVPTGLKAYSRSPPH